MPTRPSRQEFQSRLEPVCNDADVDAYLTLYTSLEEREASGTPEGVVWAGGVGEGERGLGAFHSFTCHQRGEGRS